MITLLVRCDVGRSRIADKPFVPSICFRALHALGSRGAMIVALLAGTTQRNLIAQQATFSLERELTLDGGAEGFSRISSVRTNSRGDIAITFPQDAQIQIYDLSGRLISTFGRRGAGPGEFQAFFDVKGWIGDTIWIVDGMSNRLTYVSRTGRLLRTESLADQGWKRTGSSGTVVNFTPSARSANGVWLGTGSFYNSEERHLRGFVALTSTDARFVASIRADSTYKFWPFAAGAVSAFSHDGEHVAYASASSLVLRSGKYKVNLFRSNGDTVYVREFDYVGVPLARRTVDSILARGVGPNRLRTLPNDQIPPVHRPLEALDFSSDGRLWITIRESSASSAVIVLDQRGAAVARIPLPARTSVMAADRARVWLKEEDENGVETLVRYRLVERSKN